MQTPEQFFDIAMDLTLNELYCVLRSLAWALTCNRLSYEDRDLIAQIIEFFPEDDRIQSYTYLLEE